MNVNLLAHHTLFYHSYINNSGNKTLLECLLNTWNECKILVSTFFSKTNSHDCFLDANKLFPFSAKPHHMLGYCFSNLCLTNLIDTKI